jgi:hypothetical protein
VQLIQVIEDTLNNPPIPYEPTKQSLKAWVMFCLRNRGFKLDIAPNADFVVESRTEGKIPFKTTEDAPAPNTAVGWVIWNCDTQRAQVTSPQP